MSSARVAWWLTVAITSISLAAAIGYLLAGEYRKGIYWLAATVIGATFL